jgi:hypothetical protein
VIGMAYGAQLAIFDVGKEGGLFIPTALSSVIFETG